MSGLDDISKQLGFSTGSELLGQVGDGFFGTDTLKDYSHASKLMRPNGLSLAPKQKFLFHVYFNTSDNKNFFKSDDTGLVGALVKSIQLPTFRLDTEEYIQYNRKRLVHNKITYEPVSIKLHDDGEGHVTNMWYNYYNYYFADPSYEYTEGMQTSPGINGKSNYNDRDLYSPDRVGQTRGWGKTIDSTQTNGNKPAFFKDIKIYGFNRGGFVLYTLINPVITSWAHDTYDYADNAGIMEHNVTIQYEAVKYLDSATANKETVSGFAKESRYDTEPGALGPGSTTSLFGQGGLQDTFGAVTTDLANGNLPAAMQKVGASARTFGDIGTLTNVIKADGINALAGANLDAIGGNPSRLMNFPKPGETSGGKSIARPKKA